MYLSRTPSPKLLLDEDLPLRNRLVPLTTKYYSPKSTAEQPGWRDAAGRHADKLEIETQRPFVVKSKAQWTSQPRYPHARHARNVSMPNLPRPKPRKGLLKVALSPTVGDLLQLAEPAPEETKVFLPPLRLPDNRSSHHDHHGVVLADLRVTSDSDLFSHLKIQPQPAKVRREGHRPTPRTVTSGTVHFRPMARLNVAIETERPPYQESRVFEAYVKPRDIPEQFIRRAKVGRKAEECGREEELSSGAIMTSEDFFESRDSFISYSEESVDAREFEGKGIISYGESEVGTTAAHSPQQEKLRGGREDNQKRPPNQEIAGNSDSKVEISRINSEAFLISESCEQSDGLSSSMTLRELKTEIQASLPDVLPGLHSSCIAPAPTSQPVLSQPTPDLLRPLDDPPPVFEDKEEKTDLAESDLRLSTRNSPARMSTQTTLETKTTESTLKVAEDGKNVVEQIEMLAEGIEESTDGVFTPCVVINPAQSLKHPISSKSTEKLRAPPTSILPTSSKQSNELSEFPVALEVREEQKIELRPVENVPGLSLIQEAIVEEQSEKDTSRSGKDAEAIARQLSRTVTHSSVNSELYGIQKSSKFDGTNTLSPPRRSISDIVSLQRQLSRASAKEEKKTKKNAKPAKTKKAVTKPQKRKSPVAKSPPKLKLPRPSIETLPGLIIEAPVPFISIASVDTPLDTSRIDSIPSPTISKGSLLSAVRPSRRGSVASILTRRDSMKDSVTRRESAGGSASRRGSVRETMSRKNSFSSLLPLVEEVTSSKQVAKLAKPTDAVTYKGLEFASADEVFVRQFSFALMKVILGVSGAPEMPLSDLISQQLETIRSKVLKVDYNPTEIAKGTQKPERGVLSMKSEGESKLSTPTSVKSPVFRSRTGSILSPSSQSRSKQRASVILKPTMLMAMHKIPKKSKEELVSDEDDSSDSDDVESRRKRVLRASQSLTEFELKHLSLLKNLATNLAAKEEEKKKEDTIQPTLSSEESSSYEEEPKPSAPVTDVWFTGHAEDLEEDVHQSLATLFRDFKDCKINAFTAAVTNFFKDPQAAKTVDVMEATEKEEMDLDNYKESVERRKFLELVKMLPEYQALHLTAPGVLQQTGQERLHPRELREYFRLSFVKRKFRAHLLSERNGTSPAELYAKPSYTFSGLDSRVHAQKRHRPHLSEPCIEDVILSGGAHMVTDDAVYRERLYCRMKQEQNLSKFALKPKSHRSGTLRALGPS